MVRPPIFGTFYILKHPVDYRDLGADYFDRLHSKRLKRKLIKRLKSLGFQVTLASSA